MSCIGIAATFCTIKWYVISSAVSYPTLQQDALKEVRINERHFSERKTKGLKL